MARQEWEALPPALRQAVQRHTGTVLGAHSPSAGRSSDISTTLHTTSGPVFCKGVLTASRGAWMHRNEALLNPYLPASAPRLLWTVEQEGWLLLGYEHLSGRHADFSPGSPDLTLVTDTVLALRRDLTVCPPVDVRSFPDRLRTISAWSRLRADPPAELPLWQHRRLEEFVALETLTIEAVEGPSLLHTDLHPLNILIADTARVIDWAWACRGAPWVDLHLFALRLVVAGHSPTEADAWLTEHSGALAVSRREQVGFAVAVCGLWEYRSRRDPAPHWPALLAGARSWAQHLLI